MDEFQQLLSGYVDREGLPDVISAWATVDLQTLIKIAEGELTRRDSSSAGASR